MFILKKGKVLSIVSKLKELLFYKSVQVFKTYNKNFNYQVENEIIGGSMFDNDLFSLMYITDTEWNCIYFLI